MGNSGLRVTNAVIQGNLYAGGNGMTAVVHGNTSVNVDGAAVVGSDVPVTAASGCVFGGGNAAATGTAGANNSASTVNIVGGTIYGNVYGGANTSVIYGTSSVNLGYNTVNDTSLTKADVYIKGTIFGGGEANAAGSDTYDYSFISVTNGIKMNIDGTGYTNFNTRGSIFGSRRCIQHNWNKYNKYKKLWNSR